MIQILTLNSSIFFIFFLEFQISYKAAGDHIRRQDFKSVVVIPHPPPSHRRIFVLEIGIQKLHGITLRIGSVLCHFMIYVICCPLSFHGWFPQRRQKVSMKLDWACLRLPLRHYYKLYFTCGQLANFVDFQREKSLCG